MKAPWLLLLLLSLPAAADKVEGTLVQIQSDTPDRVLLCTKNGDVPGEAVLAEVSRCREIFSRGLGYRWTLFCNRSPNGSLTLTSASSLGPDSATGGAFDLIRQQIRLINAENWAQAWNGLSADGRPAQAAFAEQWRGTLLSEQPADWQILCCNSNRVTIMVGGSHARGSMNRFRYNPRTSTCNIDCRLQGFRWAISSMTP